MAGVDRPPADRDPLTIRTHPVAPEIRLDQEGRYVITRWKNVSGARSQIDPVTLIVALVSTLPIAGLAISSCHGAALVAIIAWPTLVMIASEVLQAHTRWGFWTGSRPQYEHVDSPITRLIGVVPSERRTWYLQTYARNIVERPDPDQDDHTTVGLVDDPEPLGHAMELADRLLGDRLTDAEVLDQLRRLILIMPDAHAADQDQDLTEEIDRIVDEVAERHHAEIRSQQATQQQALTDRIAEYLAARRALGLPSTNDHS